MFNFSSKPSRPKSAPSHLVGIDLGTIHSKILVFDYSGSVPAVVGYARVTNMDKAMVQGVVSDKALVLEALASGMEEAMESCPLKPTQVVFGLSGAMVHNFTTLARSTRPASEEPITERELEEISTQIEDAAGIQVAGESVKLVGEIDAELELVNSAITTTKIDGYYVSDPVGYKGENLEVGIFTAFSPSACLDSIQQIAKGLRLEILTVTSSFYAFLRSLRKKDLSEFNALLIDIGGQVTSVGVVIGGGIVASKSFPLGLYHFNLAVSQALGVDIEEAKKVRQAYLDGDSSVAGVEQVGEIMTQVLGDWSTGFEVVLGSFSGVKSFPSEVLLMGIGANLPEVQAVLADEIWTKNFPFSQELKSKIVTPADLRVKDLTGKLSGPQDVLPAALGQVGKEILTKV